MDFCQLNLLSASNLETHSSLSVFWTWTSITWPERTSSIWVMDATSRSKLVAIWFCSRKKSWWSKLTFATISWWLTGTRERTNTVKSIALTTTRQFRMSSWSTHLIAAKSLWQTFRRKSRTFRFCTKFLWDRCQSKTPNSCDQRHARLSPIPHREHRSPSTSHKQVNKRTILQMWVSTEKWQLAVSSTH